MRGSFSYHDLMHCITYEDREILQRIVKENIELVEKTKMAII
jgi:hypothetical protein